MAPVVGKKRDERKRMVKDAGLLAVWQDFVDGYKKQGMTPVEAEDCAWMDVGEDVKNRIGFTGVYRTVEEIQARKAEKERPVEEVLDGKSCSMEDGLRWAVRVGRRNVKREEAPGEEAWGFYQYQRDNPDKFWEMIMKDTIKKLGGSDALSEETKDAAEGAVERALSAALEAGR